MVSTLMVMPGVFGRTELGADRTGVAPGLDVLGLYMLPQPSLVLGGPQAVHALPKIPSFTHFGSYFSLQIYTEREFNSFISTSLMEFALVLMPSVLR